MSIAAGNPHNPYVVIRTGMKHASNAAHDTPSETRSPQGWNPEHTPVDVNRMIMQYLKDDSQNENLTYAQLRFVNDHLKHLQHVIERIEPKIRQETSETRECAQRAREACKDPTKSREEVEALQRKWIQAAKKLSNKKEVVKDALRQLKKKQGLREFIKLVDDLVDPPQP